MVVYFYFKAFYCYIFCRKTAFLTACLVALTAPALAQNVGDSRLCRAYEEDLRAIDSLTRFSPHQIARYQQLAQIQQQAKSDARRYSCNATAFSNGSDSEQCRYISNALVRIDTAMRDLHRQAATPQQRHMRQEVYADMRRYNCRSPQNLDRQMKENRAVTTVHKRSPQTYKKPKTMQQAALPVQPATEAVSDIIPVKATASVGKSPFSIPAAPDMSHMKAAEKSPPLAQEAVDYVPDPTIRRVGPAYFPAR